MKLSIALLSILSVAKTSAAGANPHNGDADLTAFLEDLKAPTAGEDGRSLYGVADDCEAKNGNPAQAYYYPNPPSDWNDGTCSYGTQCQYNTYTSEVACCLENFKGQPGSECLIKAGAAPTESPTSTKQQGSGSGSTSGSGGTGYYSVMANNWLDGTCTNKRPFPVGQEWWEDHLYDSMLECCKGVFPNQSTGKCVAQLPDGERPTSSPTTGAEAGMAGIYYPDYDTAWTVAGCLNTLPLPYNRHNGQPDRPEFATLAECCAKSYGGQVSGKCKSMMDSDSDSGGVPTSADFYYRDYSVAWDVGTCTNTLPLPIQVTEGSNTDSTKEACCKSRFGGQMSNACVCDLDVPAKVCYEIKTTTITTSIEAGTLDVTIPETLPTGWELTELVKDLVKDITEKINSVSGEDEEVKKVTILSIGDTNIKNYRRLGELPLSNKNSRSLQEPPQIKAKIEMEYSCLPGKCSDAEKKVAEIAKVGHFYTCTKVLVEMKLLTEPSETDTFVGGVSGGTEENPKAGDSWNWSKNLLCIGNDNIDCSESTSVGNAYGVSTYVNDGDSYITDEFYSLPVGTLMISSIEYPNSSKYASVVGGTGCFAGAYGQTTSVVKENANGDEWYNYGLHGVIIVPQIM